MSYTALYRKYRPSTFDDVAGQRHIVTTLTNALSQNRLAHAYLFSGPSGNGKTSVAKLFAKAINCESETEIICDKCHNCLATKNNTHPDIIEIDAASNNGVDEIRDLIEKVKYSPLNGKYKIYIIDEVHMLTLGAFNALLKTLEEPPEHVVFILATTEPHKVIPTIISRCQRYDFTRVKEKDIYDNIVKILNNEDIDYEPEAIELISDLADGGVRESLSILEQSVAYAINDIKVDDVRKIYGVVTKAEKLQLLGHIFNQDMQSTLMLLESISDQGNNLERLNLELINILKECVIYSYAQSETLLNVLNVEEANKITKQFSAKQLLEMIDILMEIDAAKKNISNLNAYLELGFIKMISIAEGTNPTTQELERETITKPVTQPIQTETVSRPAPQIQEQAKVAPVETPVQQTVEAPQEQEEIVKVTINNQDVNVQTSDNKNHVEENLSMDLDVETVELDKPETIEKPIQQETLQEVKTVKYDKETLLSLLTFAIKEKRLYMSNKWSTIETYCTDMKYAKYAHKLKDTRLIAVGSNYALVEVDNQIMCDDLNTEDNQIGISEFIKDKLEEDLRVFAITSEASEDLISAFRERALKGTLPSEVNVDILKSTVVEKKDSFLDKADSVFGVDGYIVEES